MVSFLTGISQGELNRLHLEHNHLARIATSRPCRARISSVLASFHWLPVPQRISYKLASLIYKIRASFIYPKLIYRAWSQIIGLHATFVLDLKTYWTIEQLPLPRLHLLSVQQPLSFRIHCLNNFVHPALYQFLSLAWRLIFSARHLTNVIYIDRTTVSEYLFYL